MQDAGNNNRPSTSSGIGYCYTQGPLENNTMGVPNLVEEPPDHNSTATSLRLAMISQGAL